MDSKIVHDNADLKKNKITLFDFQSMLFISAAKKRFLQKTKVNKESGCIEWIGKRDAFGYGTICILPISKYAKTHRIAWCLSNGTIPIDKPHILHKCDNPSCVNPDHLFCGTHQDNVADCVNKKRNSSGKNEGHRNAKLNWAQIKQIRLKRENGETYKNLSNEYMVGRDQISRICTYKVWKS